MNVAAVIKDALGPLVGDRVHPNTFPQPPQTPVWPAVRFTVINRDPDVTVDGTDDGESDDVRVQLDIVATGYEAARALRDTCLAVLQSPTCVRAGESETYDTETKTHRFIVDVVFTPSTSAGSPD